MVTTLFVWSAIIVESKSGELLVRGIHSKNLLVMQKNIRINSRLVEIDIVQSTLIASVR